MVLCISLKYRCIQDRMSEFCFPFFPHPLLTLLMGGDESCLQVRTRGMNREGEGWWDTAAKSVSF